jgi:hypothetical protein
LANHPALLELGHADRQGPGDLSGDPVLQGEEVGKRLVETNRPEHATIRIDELGGNPHAVGGVAHAAFDLIAHPKLAADLARA